MRHWNIPLRLLLSLTAIVIIYAAHHHYRAVPSPIAPSAPSSAIVATPSLVPPAVTAPVPWPIAGGKDRVTKKFFGTYVTPQNSPVQPEKFTGYHTGWDFETTPAELNTDLQIVAACDGPLIYRQYASGYGGVAIQSCVFQGQPVTVLYGHLRLASITAQGTSLKVGDKIGLLGNAYSTETDGERKHLHFDIHKGTAIELKGYVQTKADLSAWIDPASFFQ